MTDHLAASARTLSTLVDPTRPMPLYQQLSDGLRRQVIFNAWPADLAIPSERELMRLTGLSRMTVRQALDSLTREGLLRRVHGRGTFIVPDRVDQDLSGVYSFSQRMQSEGFTVRTEVHQAIERPAGLDEANHLELVAGTPVFHLVRVRTLDGEPLVVNNVILPSAFFPGLLDRDLTASLYGIMTDVYGRRPFSSIDTLEAIGAPREIAELLAVKPGAPVSLVLRIASTQAGTRIEMTEEYARSDRMRYRLQQWADPVLDRSTTIITKEVHA